MVDELVKRCDNPKCSTPYEDVKRITSDLEDEGQVVVDLCQLDREPIIRIRNWAHKKPRRTGIVVTDPTAVKRVTT